MQIRAGLKRNPAIQLRIGFWYTTDWLAGGRAVSSCIPVNPSPIGQPSRSHVDFSYSSGLLSLRGLWVGVYVGGLPKGDLVCRFHGGLGKSAGQE